MSRYLRQSPWIQPAEILDIPYPPDSQDDEFNTGAVLNAAWTRTGTFDDVTPIDPYATFAGITGMRWSHNGIRPSWYMMQPSGNSTVPNIYKTVSLPTNCFVWMRGSFCFRNSSAPVTDAQLGMGLYTAAPAFTDGVLIELNDAGTLNSINITMGRINAGVFTLIKSTLSDGAVNAQGAQPIECIGLQKRGTTYDGWALTSLGWLHIGSTTHASTFVTCPIYASNSVTTSPGNMIMALDFWRFKNGIWLP